MRDDKNRSAASELFNKAGDLGVKLEVLIEAALHVISLVWNPS